jgi:hypothetical protein
MASPPRLSLEVDDLGDLEDGSSDKSAAGGDTVLGLSSSEESSSEEEASPDEFFCDRCEQVRETPGTARSSPRPIVGLRYSKDGASLCP